ncbi:F0F1 ATP synthase subunit A [Vampirovibrio sp.]|uniref:F0F1 ATP synthase subunit A n=1 Tax=Vampirovibrio sp. TaxID=2717857 RepID=UPI00359461C0
MEHEWVVQLLGQEVNLNTLIMVWLGLGVILVTAWLFTRNLKVIPSPLQVVGEGVFDVCRSITMATAGKRGDGFLYFVGSIFLFILTANVMGQLPLRLFHIPAGELKAATADINTTAALGVATLLFYIGYGIYKKGLGYFKHYISPSPWYIGIFFLPINILEDVTRPGSLLIRLYFNILVGEILSGIALSVTPYVLPSLVIFLELFVAVVQAYIFAILSSVYISLLSEEHH